MRDILGGPCTFDHSSTGGLKVPEGLLIEPKINQLSRLANLPTELLLIIFNALKSDPVAQVSLAMTCKYLLRISSMATILICCTLRPWGARRFRLLNYIYPRITTADGTSHCTKFRLTSVAYWEEKEMRERVGDAAEDDAVPAWAWSAAVWEFAEKTAVKCPDCATTRWKDFPGHFGGNVFYEPAGSGDLNLGL
ncbi:hypothetical protein BJY01DRAFT_256236 [Aspergillus pseudoustus]|uniref:F-box domain-containing protein n=1 Tax=Aspergillus pseudoustus TaxID=1810923 RepID=A0ABR4ICS8_9EURO